MLQSSHAKPLSGRIALITGASRGIGAAVARRFAKAGAHVVLVARTVGGLEEVDDQIRAEGGQATLMPFNLLETEKIAFLGPALHEKFGRLDVLVGNAAMLGVLGPVAHTDSKIWDRTLALNLTANQRLIRTLDPLLRASDAGRAIFVTSGVTAEPEAYWGAYAVSKMALEMMVRIYAAETLNTKLRVNLVDPGIVRTAMRAEAFPGEDATKLLLPENVADIFLRLADPACVRHGQIVRF